MNNLPKITRKIQNTGVGIVTGSQSNMPSMTSINNTSDIFNNTQESDNPVSYYTFIKERQKYLKAGTKNGQSFNFYDTPTRLYFKVFFYFYNTDSDNGDEYNGLLAPTWNIYQSGENWRKYNSAYSYLMNNNELERADLLKDFINLLSNISSESPWYFKEISGLDEALKRETTPKIADERKKITIKCALESTDNRVGTLLDLYRSIVWSWQKKCEVVPANLRKFDMGIYLFSTPIIPLHDYAGVTNKEDKYAHIGPSSQGYKTSYKYFEFHNCEFSYNNSTSGLTTINNETGIKPEYNIDIEFDDVYENRYNEFLMKDLGDMIMWDTVESTPDMTGLRQTSDVDKITKSAVDSNISTGETEVGYEGRDISKDSTFVPIGVNNMNDKEVVEKYVIMNEKSLVKKAMTNIGLSDKINGALNTAKEEVVGALGRLVKTKLAGIILGNTNMYSLPTIVSQINKLSRGQVFESVDAVKSYTEKNSRKTLHFTGLGQDKKVHKDFGYVGKSLGNIYKAKTLADNV